MNQILKFASRNIYFMFVLLIFYYFCLTVIDNEQFGYIGGGISIDRVKITDSYQGVLTKGNVLKSLTITKTDITNSRNYGIRISKSITELTIENCAVNSSGYQGAYIWVHSKSTIRVVNSSFTASGNRGLAIDDYRNQMHSAIFLIDNTFSWNKKGAVYYYRRYNHYSDFPNIQFESNHFFRNHGPTVEISREASCLFSNNTFQENQGTNVISLDDWSPYGRASTLTIDGNLFIANQCPDNAVINIKRSPCHVIIITNNNFTTNLGRCVLFKGIGAHGPISISENLFHENNCEDKSVIEVFRMDKNFTFANDTFTQNRAGSVVFLQLIHDTQSWAHRYKVAINNNTLSNNIAYTSSRPSIADDSCAVVLSGIPYYKEIDFSFNKLNNSAYRRELCVRFPAISMRDVVNVTHNWWATVIAGEVRDRISDFDDNYDFAVANDWPFLLSNDDLTLTSVEQRDLKQHGSLLSGRLFESITLKASHSPYSVTSDLTVLDNVTLTVEAGVEVKINPGKSILVAGALIAHGTSAKPVKFTVKEPAGGNKGSQITIRLVDGYFPWEGRAEVFHNTSWKPVFATSSLLKRNVTKVICRQLGYGPPVAAMENSEAFDQIVNGSWFVEFLCNGNESFLHECPRKQQPLNNSNMLDVVVKCQSAPWGNLRFVSSIDVNVSEIQSVLMHVEFSHCGNRHGMDVPAIEAVTNVPKLKFISVRNCLSGGLRVYFPKTDVYLDNNTFFNTGKAGMSFVRARRNIVVENSKSSRNQQGISFEEPSVENFPRVHYGQVSLCGEERAVLAKNYLYFNIPRPKGTSVSLICEKVLTATKGQGIKLTLLYSKGTHRLKIYASTSYTNLIVDSSYGGLTALVKKELYIPRDSILVQWSGDVSSEVAILVENMNINGEFL